MRKIIGVLLCAVVAFCLAACGGSKTTEDTRETLVVGLGCAYAPFNWTENKKTDTNYPIDGTNKYADGYDVQMAKKIADGLNRRLVIKQVDWDGLIPSVQNGLIDLIIAGMSPTDERKLDIDFTNAYYTSEHVVLISTTSAYANVTSVSGFAGATFIGQTGTLYASIVAAMDSSVNKGVDKATVPEIVADIQAGIVDGTVLELPVATGLAAANSDLKIIQFAEGQGFTQLADTDEEGNSIIRDIVASDRDVAIGIAKNRTTLLNQINEILAGITEAERVEIMAGAVARQAE